jgi:hypothetical protein
MKRLLSLALFLFSIIHLLAQDSSLLKKIDSLTRLGYDNHDTVLYYLTKKDLLTTGAGTEIYLYSYKDQIQRIICFSHPPEGNVAIEFYPYHKQLLFVYENEEYVEEKVPAHAVRNFKGLGSSESRFYFWNHQLIFWKATGYSPSFTATVHARDLIIRFDNLLTWYDKRKNK